MDVELPSHPCFVTLFKTSRSRSRSITPTSPTLQSQAREEIPEKEDLKRA